MTSFIAGLVALLVASGAQAQGASAPDNIEFDGITYTFNGEKYAENPILDHVNEGLHINVPAEAGKTNEPEEAIVFRIEPEVTNQVSLLEKKSLFDKFKRAIGLKRNKTVQTLDDDIPFLPEDKTLVDNLKNQSEAEVTAFLTMYKSLMNKAQFILKKSKIPESEANELLSVLSQYLWAGADTMIQANARSVGVDVMVYGGGGSSGWFSHLLKKFLIGYLLPESHSWLFSGTGGINILRVKNSSGKKKTFVEIPVNGQRSTKMRTFAGLGGYEVYLTRSWMTGVNEDSGKPASKQTETFVLGALGTISRGEGIFSVSLNMGLIMPMSYLVGAGGFSFPPLVGALSVYDTQGRRSSMMSVSLEKVKDNFLTRSVSALYMRTKSLFSPRVTSSPVMCRQSLTPSAE